jgi:hypothetical protein
MHIYSQPNRGSTMNASVNSALPRTLRAISATLSIALIFNQCAYLASAQTAPPQPPPPPLQTAPPPQAPVPAQIAAAHTIFLVNNGADANFPTSADTAYNDVYGALQAWGHFQLVTSPDQADLVFQLRDIAPITGVYGDRAGTYAINSPAFQLAIKDPKTNVTLWTITSPAAAAGFRASRERWFNIAITNLVSRVKVLANQPLTDTETADLTLYPYPHRRALAITLAAVFVGAGVAGILIAKHSFDNKVASQNAALCAQNPFFCNMPTP